jgi:predicted nucleotidyltransferase
MTLLGMVRGLVTAKVRFVVIGGVAANAHGSARVTDDLDICYDSSDDNLRRLAATLSTWGAYLRGVEPGLPFVMDERTLRTTPVMTLITAQGSLDVMDGVLGVGGFAEVLQNSEEVESGELRFRVLSLAALISAKRATRRRKDVDQLPELEALLELRRERGEGRGSSR